MLHDCRPYIKLTVLSLCKGVFTARSLCKGVEAAYILISMSKGVPVCILQCDLSVMT